MASSIRSCCGRGQIKGDGSSARLLFLKLETNNTVMIMAITTHLTTKPVPVTRNGTSTSTERWPIERPKKYLGVLKGIYLGSQARIQGR